MLAVTPMTRVKMVAASGSAPDSPRLQRGANLSQLHSHSTRFACSWPAAWAESHCTDMVLPHGNAFDALRLLMACGLGRIALDGNGPSAWYRAMVSRLSGEGSAFELRKGK
jgi:hypothetical protein